MIDLYSLVLFFLFFLGLFLFGLFRWAAKRVTEQVPGRAGRRRVREPLYVSRGELGEHEFEETDIRLTYKRFKELYPYSEISYREYKKLQYEKAFKRAVSSQKIRRMVR